MQKYILIILLTFITSFSFAQTGSIKGKITDQTTKEAIIGANVFIEGLSIGSSTDLDGNFIIEKIPAGTYDITISYISYKSKRMEGLVIEPGKIVLLETEIEEDIAQLGDVVVVGERETNSEVSLIAEIKEAEQVAVGVSAEQIAKSQDRDAAQVIRRIPGVSLIDNRFVMIRGLSQRYNTVMLNDVITPSSEIDIKSFSFDLVPSSIIDRILIYKSGSADIPGEFAGGVIKIYTKDAPEENFVNVSISGGYRDGTTFNSIDKIKGSGTDFLGFDNGLRKLPGSFPSMDYAGASAFNINSSVQKANLGNELQNNWLAASQNINPDLRVGFSIGRRFNVRNSVIGNLTSINYTNTNQFQEVELNGYEFNASSTDVNFSYKDKQITNNIRVSILHNWLFRFNAKNTIEFKNLFNQMTFAETNLREGRDVPSNADVRSYSYRFEARSILTSQLLGKHKLGANERSSINWALGFSYINRQEPDWRRVRTIRTTGTTGDYTVVIPANANPVESGRFFSKLNETVLTASANFDQLLGNNKTSEESAKLKVGFYIERKDRSFEARFFGYQRGTSFQPSTLTQPLDQIFGSANVNGTTGFTLTEGTNPNDKYVAANTLFAGYTSLFLPITNRFTATIGIRVEYNTQEIESRLRTFNKVNVSNPIISPLPSVNLTYDLNDKSLIRFAYSMSINRPEFRELAPFDFYDFNLNANIIGNPKLQTATIQNLDVRYEWYPSPSELISFGVFYKSFLNPIENFLLPNSSGSLSYTFVNAKDAVDYGAEIEIRKSFSGSSNGFIKNLSFVGNASYIVSRVDLGSTLEIPDPSGTTFNVNVADTQDANRPMMNQSPYLVNLGLYYNNERSGWQFSVLYNVFGPRIFTVGNTASPSVYEKQRNILDLSFTKTVAKKLDIKLGIQDILNQPFKLVQDVDKNAKINSNDVTSRAFKRGTYYTLGLSYTF